MAVVRMFVKLSGLRDGLDWPAAGELLVCPDAEAAQLIGTRLATAVKGAVDVVERAVVTPEVETAVVKRGPGRPRKEG